jgi:hypothetical protein
MDQAARSWPICTPAIWGLVEKAKATLQIPVIASLNGVTPTTN